MAGVTKPRRAAVAGLAMVAVLAGMAAGAGEQAAPSRYPLPQGGVEALVEFLRGLKGTRQEVNNRYQTQLKKLRDEYEAQIRALTEAETEAAEKIMRLAADKNSEAYLMAARIALPARLENLSAADIEKQKSVLADVKRFLASRAAQGLDWEDFVLARTTASKLEYGEHPELAADAYASFAELIAKSPDESIARDAQRFEANARRLSLLGKPLELAGETMDGTPLDWNAYRGKVVLVVFWATWWGPCKAEFRNVKQCYAEYHDRGFDVVGISLDRDRAALEEYLRKEAIPWTTLHEKGGQGSHAMATLYGITGIPSMFLVDRQGKVVSLRARGEELDKLLAQLLGPASSTAKQAAAATP